MACGPTKRQIDILRDRFIPDAARCEADHADPDFGKCGEFVVTTVRVDGQEKWVCGGHLDVLLKEKHSA